MGCASSRVSPAAEPAVTDVAEEAAMAEKKARVEAAICAYRRAAAETAAEKLVDDHWAASLAQF